MTLAMPIFEKFLSSHVQTVLGNVHVKSEVHSFNRFAAITFNTRKFRGRVTPPRPFSKKF